MSEEIQKLADTFISSKTEESYKKLIERIEPGMLAYASHILKNDIDANDVVCSVLEDIWFFSEKYYDKNKSNFSTWIYNILKNRTYKFIYAKNRKFAIKYVSENDYNISERVISSSDISVPNIYMEGGHKKNVTQSEIDERLIQTSKEMIGFLPRNLSLVMTDRYINGKKVDDIAREYGKTTTTIRNWITRGTKTLRKMVEAENPSFIDMSNRNC